MTGVGMRRNALRLLAPYGVGLCHCEVCNLRGWMMYQEIAASAGPPRNDGAGMRRNALRLHGRR